MARLKKVDLFPEYMRTEDVDYAFLATATAVAKGRLSMRDFAERCGTSGATISRIINQQINAPISDQLLKAIAESVPEDSGITLDTLLKANGLRNVIVEDVAKEDSLEYIKRQNQRALSRERGMIQLKIAREVLQNELLERGYSLSVEYSEAQLSNARYWDFEFKTDAFKSLGLDYWCFDVKFGNSIHSIHAMNTIFSKCYLNSQDVKKRKISVVVFDENHYQSLKNRYKDQVIPDYISIILIDMNERCVVEEFCFPTEGDNIELFKGGNAHE